MFGNEIINQPVGLQQLIPVNFKKVLPEKERLIKWLENMCYQRQSQLYLKNYSEINNFKCVDSSFTCLSFSKML